METKIINLTPHAITVEMADGQRVSFPPSGAVARCAARSVLVRTLEEIPVFSQEFGEIEGLPLPKEGCFYITSTLVSQRALRADVLSPDTGPTAIRENGQVVAVRGFQNFAGQEACKIFQEHCW